MAHYDRKSSERLSNGHYKIQGQDYMSIWTFKNIYNILPNSNKDNAKDAQGIDSSEHTCEVEINSVFESVNIYLLAVLKDYYKVK